MAEVVISVISACYNHGAYLDDAIGSVKNYDWKVPVEHIIVNDGSTDPATIEKIAQLKEAGVNIIDQPNGGPANARNTALRYAKGGYVLPLDTDNRLRPAVFEKALDIMQADPSISVVYPDAQCFGDETYLWQPGELNPELLLARNHIDTCSLMRTKELIAMGGYDDKIPVHGNEDWDLWLRMYFENKKMYYLREIGFDYRIINRSLSRRESTPRQDEINEYIVKKYAAQYARHYAQLYDEKKKFENLKSFLRNNKLKSVLKTIMGKPLVKY